MDKTLDRGESVDVVYLDFMKAFDTVPYKRLIGNLNRMVLQTTMDPGVLV